MTVRAAPVVAGARSIAVVFDLIGRYAIQQGWVPIGWRVFAIGPWTVTVNGTKEVRDGVPPFHALIEHRDVVSIMLVSPFDGISGGWSGAEAAFIAALEAEA